MGNYLNPNLAISFKSLLIINNLYQITNKLVRNVNLLAR